MRPSTDVAVTRSTWRPGFARFVPQLKRNGGRRSTVRVLPSTLKTILAALAPQGRTRSRMFVGALIQARAPALVNANVLLSTTTRVPSTS